MTVLFQGNRTIPAGQDVNVFTIPRNAKRAGVALNVRITLDAAPFPTGRTTIEIELSQDGGVTFPFTTTPMAFDRPPAPTRLGAAESLGFELGVNDDPTHARITTNAPAAFTTAVTITAQ